MREITRNIVSAVLVSKDAKILFGKKDPAKGGVYADCWHIPGGGIDDGEDQITALKREIMEEVGIDISTAHVSLLDDRGRGTSEKTLKDTGERVLCHMVFHVYEVHLDQNAADVRVSLNDDLVEYQWVDKANLTSIEVPPPGVELYKRLRWI
ncbi:MAG: NUDIX hydrolase [Candidatus Kerfeldbacteria bacterium]|nr:NUDIX hydrolase [Candidatus Kerfeldbacteria bacterium]